MENAKEILALIEKHDVIAIFAHGYPDGDCYGCQMGLRSLLRAHYPNKKIYALGSGVPKLFPILGEMDQTKEEDLKDALGILVDVSTLVRVESPLWKACKEFAKIDHHEMGPNDDPFPGPAIVDTSRVSCAEILGDLCIEWGFGFNALAASSFYTGILTDSGGLYFEGITRHTCDLLDEFFTFDIPARKILDTYYAEDPKVTEYKKWMKKNAKKEGQVCYLRAYPKDYQAYGLEFEKASSLVNALDGLFEAKIYVYFCEREDGWTRVEYRSNANYPVVEVARSFGGGGHRYASGSTVIHGKPDPMEIVEALNRVNGDE